MKIFTDYSEPLHNYLRILGNDVSRIDQLIKTGRKPTFISSYFRSNGGWEKGIGVSDNPKPGEFLDEKMIMVNPNEFYEYFGGVRYKECKKSNKNNYPCNSLNTSMGFLTLIKKDN